MTAPGQPWGRPASAPPDVEGSGDDAALAMLVQEHPGARVRFAPGPRCDFALSVGLAAGTEAGTELKIDALRVDGTTVVMNAAVIGPAPDRLRRHHRATETTVEIDGRVAFSGSATTVLIANGQFLRGKDVVPRGHPGDGRIEVHVYVLAPAERRGMRRRIPGGDHLPHPRIRTFSAKSVTVTTGRRLGLELDGHRAGRSQAIAVEVIPGACELLV
jgi:hypothetical protein